MNLQTIFSHDNSKLQLAVPLGLAVALLALWALGYGPTGTKCAAAQSVEMRELTMPQTDTLSETPMPAESELPEALLALDLPQNANIYFAIDSDKVTDEDLKGLTKIIEFITYNPTAKITITSVYGKGENQTKEMAQRRATNAALAIQNLGIEQNRIIKLEPQIAKDDEEEAKTRRVEVSVIE